LYAPAGGGVPPFVVASGGTAVEYPVIASGGIAAAKVMDLECPPPVIASGGTARCEEMGLEWSVAISGNDPGTNGRDCFAAYQHYPFCTSPACARNDRKGQCPLP